MQTCNTEHYANIVVQKAQILHYVGSTQQHLTYITLQYIYMWRVCIAKQVPVQVLFPKQI